MMMSILHRATGVALAVGALALVCWLLAVASGPEAYARFTALAGSPLGQIALLGFCACLIYHLLNGIRHLLWDIGYGYEIPKLYATGWTVLALTVLITGALCFVAMNAGGAA